MEWYDKGINDEKLSELIPVWLLSGSHSPRDVLIDDMSHFAAVVFKIWIPKLDLALVNYLANIISVANYKEFLTFCLGVILLYNSSWTHLKTTPIRQSRQSKGSKQSNTITHWIILLAMVPTMQFNVWPSEDGVETF